MTDNTDKKPEGLSLGGFGSWLNRGREVLQQGTETLRQQVGEVGGQLSETIDRLRKGEEGEHEITAAMVTCGEDVLAKHGVLQMMTMAGAGDPTIGEDDRKARVQALIVELYREMDNVRRGKPAAPNRPE